MFIIFNSKFFKMAPENSFCIRILHRARTVSNHILAFFVQRSTYRFPHSKSEHFSSNIFSENRTELKTREIYTKNLRAVTRNFAQLCEIARNYA